MVERDYTMVWTNRLDPTLDMSAVVGHSMFEFMDESCWPEVKRELNRCFECGELGYYEVCGYDGGAMAAWYGTRVVPLPADEFGRVRALLLSTDITQRHLAEEALRESEGRFRMLTEVSPDFVTIVDREHRVTYQNRDPPAAAGVTKETLLGRQIEEFISPEHRALVAGAIDAAFRSGTTASVEFVAQHSKRMYTSRLLRLPDATHGERTVMVSMDVTTQRLAEAERRGLEAQLFQAQKMESIGQLAGGVAHDFNNMITVMALHLETACEFTDRGELEATRGELVHIAAATKRAAELTGQLLAFARRQPHQPRAVLASELATNAVRLLSRLIPASIKLECSIEAPDVWVMADAALIEQVITNLCVNARDAIGRERGSIVVGVSRRDVAENELLGSIQPDAPGRVLLPGGQYVAISVRDTGSGIRESELQRIFEPFYTTKPAGQGTGLGLAMAHGIVTQHQGFLTVDSKLGFGSTFTVYLPRAAQKEQPVAATPSATRRRSRATILVAEDEPMVRRLVVNLLRREGHEVIEADNGARAVEMVCELEGPLDLLFLDAVMPEMDGKETYERIVALRPGVRAIFSSGYAGDMLPSAFIEAHGLRLVPKPYDTKTLLAAVDAALNRSG